MFFFCFIDLGLGTREVSNPEMPMGTETKKQKQKQTPTNKNKTKTYTQEILALFHQRTSLIENFRTITFLPRQTGQKKKETTIAPLPPDKME